MNSLVALSSVGHKHGALDIHPYFGRMDPALASALIAEFSAPGERVLDPFCGSGTVLHEAVLAGRSATGWDSSSLACMIAAAKTCGIDTVDTGKLSRISVKLEEYLDPNCEDLTLFDFHQWVPEMPRVRSISKWFNDQALRELVLIQNEIEKLSFHHPGSRALLLARTAFSRCIVSASNQKGESKYVAVEKPRTPGRVLSLFLKALDGVQTSARAFSELAPFPPSTKMHANNMMDHQTTIGPLTVETRMQDSRSGIKSTGSSLFDLVVTSPPYLMSWDYGLYHKFRFYWLGLDLDAYENTEIGRHLRRKGDDVERYTQDMTSTVTNLKLACKPGAHLAFVNAVSAVGGESVDTSDIIVSVAEQQGLRLVWRGDSLHIPGPHHGMYASLTSRGASAGGESGKREHVIILQTAAES